MVETHRLTTKFGPVDVRVYRLNDGWWPVALAGRSRLPAEPVVDGEVLPESVDAAVQRLAEAIDVLDAVRPGADEEPPER